MPIDTDVQNSVIKILDTQTIFPDKKLEGKYCLAPFRTIEVDIRGNVRLCECAAWMPLTVGNLFEHSLEQILSNTHSIDIRSSISNGTYRFCDERRCGVILHGQLIPLEMMVEKHRAMISAPTQWAMPNVIRIAGDVTCNLSCPSCRNEIIRVDSSQYLKQVHLGFLLQKNLFSTPTKDHITLHVSTSGEIFASALLMKFIADINVEEFPNIDLCLQTNGLLAEKNWHRLGDMKQRVSMITVTTDAATAPTYEKLRRGGKWLDCQRSLSFISNKKQSNGMKLVMRMVVQKENFKEIEQFYEQACLLHADVVEYVRLSDWHTSDREQFAENDVFDPKHRQYAEAQKTFDKVKKFPNVFYSGGIS